MNKNLNQIIKQPQDSIKSLSNNLHNFNNKNNLDSLSYLDSLSLLQSQINQKIQKLNVSIPDSIKNSLNVFAYLDSMQNKLPDSSVNQYLRKAKDLAQKAGIDLNDPKQLEQIKSNYQEYTEKIDDWQPDIALEVPEGMNSNILSQDLEIPQIPNMNELNESNQEIQAVTQEFNQYSGKIKNIDQSIESYAQSSAANQYFQENKGEFTHYENMQNQWQDQYGQPMDMDSLKNLWQQKKKVLANDFLLKNQDKIKPIQQKIKKYTNKYTQFNSAKDVAEGKEKPVKAKPKNRITWGTNFQFNPGDPVSVDLSPMLGYRFTTRLSLNLGASLRYQLDRANDFKPPTNDNVVYGYRLFTEYKVIRSFYAHLEWERYSRPVGENRDWANALMAGIGKQFAVTKTIQGNVVVLYDFLNNQQSAHNNAFIIRFGFRRK